MISIYDLLNTALAELGLPAPGATIETLLLKDGYFVGQKLSYDGGYAVVRADGLTMDVFDDQETLLKTVLLTPEKGAVA